jgi:hypothetical protein
MKAEEICTRWSRNRGRQIIFMPSLENGLFVPHAESHRVKFFLSRQCTCLRFVEKRDLNRNLEAFAIRTVAGLYASAV